MATPCPPPKTHTHIHHVTPGRQAGAPRPHARAPPPPRGQPTQTRCHAVPCVSLLLLPSITANPRLLVPTDHPRVCHCENWETAAQRQPATACIFEQTLGCRFCRHTTLRRPVPTAYACHKTVATCTECSPATQASITTNMMYEAQQMPTQTQT
jgi:hypothetical protein